MLCYRTKSNIHKSSFNTIILLPIDFLTSRLYLCTFSHHQFIPLNRSIIVANGIGNQGYSTVTDDFMKNRIANSSTTL